LVHAASINIRPIRSAARFGLPPGMAISARIFLVELRDGESMSTIAFFGFLELRS
jgi:hypothetical protein